MTAAGGGFPRIRGSGRQAGFTVLELMMVVAVVALLAGFAIDRLIGLRVDAERVQMQRVIATLRSAARMEMAEIIVHGDMQRLARLDGTNPMALLEQPPPNYGGARDGIDEEPGVETGGRWYFDDGHLAYAAENAEYFRSSGPEGAVRFRLSVRFDDADGNGRFNPGVDHPRALVLEAVDDYRWLREPVAPAVAEMETGSQSGS